ncbi:transglycosylase [Longimycelium tulufanense]|uniref:Transglycosylase n=1 Tax=Longimycelium tulufanense TaxID=907463 RepID=A0A8J3CE90_9PSEU|nr:NlpC/P60 family protein [Longimycelium tulufanense]GGM82000.1 transglycosylase [Longimycelium tulufanense]
MTPRSAITVGIAGGAAFVLAIVLGVVVLGGSEPVQASLPSLNVDGVPEPFRRWIIQAGQECPEIGAAVLAAQIEVESNWSPQATSHAGAVGLAQFMPGTWARWGVDADGDGTKDPRNPADAILAQARYMCYLSHEVRRYLAQGRLHGDPLDLALAAYNAGLGNVLAAGGVPVNGETERYAPKIRRALPRYALLTGGAGTTSAFGQGMVEAALAQHGKPYIWGGGNYFGPTGGGFDCSGLVQYAAYQASDGKLRIIRPADAQARQGQHVDPQHLQPGDVIAFRYHGAAEYHHIGIYIGHGQMVHAPDVGDVVKTSDITTSYWKSMEWEVRRYA